MHLYYAKFIEASSGKKDEAQRWKPCMTAPELTNRFQVYQDQEGSAIWHWRESYPSRDIRTYYRTKHRPGGLIYLSQSKDQLPLNLL